MLIISKRETRDYYDMVAGQKGIDKTIVFERHPLTLSYNVTRRGKYIYYNTQNFPSFGKMNQGYNYNNTKVGDKYFKLFLVGFCGKIYIASSVKTVVTVNTPFKTASEVVSYIYGLDNIKKAVCEFEKNDKYFEEFKNKYHDFGLQHIIDCSNDSNIIDLFHIHKTPQFILFDGEKDNLHINGNFKNIGFIKVFDPFMAFQEIEMYITGVLGINNKPTIEISDKDKITGHGFDPKYSFRKEPGNKK